MMVTRRLFLSLAATCAACLTSINSFAQSDASTPSWRGEQPVRARHYMVVSVHHLASDAGLEILRAGGNA
ncbi:MAG TPA: hypothetical protein VHA37_06980, partial [Candidatus Saccharimonadales bacterium]|nr:hypothetical protein [Candidatus Saccharimonadales bacterium]